MLIFICKILISNKYRYIGFKKMTYRCESKFLHQCRKSIFLYRYIDTLLPSYTLHCTRQKNINYPYMHETICCGNDQGFADIYNCVFLVYFSNTNIEVLFFFADLSKFLSKDSFNGKLVHLFHHQCDYDRKKNVIMPSLR